MNRDHYAVTSPHGNNFHTDSLEEAMKVCLKKCQEEEYVELLYEVPEVPGTFLTLRQNW